MLQNWFSMFVGATKIPQERFMKATKAMTDPCAREWNAKGTRKSALKGQEWEPTKPTNKNNPTPLDIDKCRSELSEHCNDKKRHRRNKAQGFIMEQGQCLLRMQKQSRVA